MKNARTKLLLILFTVVTAISYGQNTITQDEIASLLGEWEGSLTYMDYSSNKPFTMPANVDIRQGRNKNQVVLYNSYPNEPKANDQDKIRISKDGTQINDKEITAKEQLSNGQLKITTQFEGKDNKKPALIRNVYIFGQTDFIIKKMVKFEDKADWILRSKYTYSR